MHGTIMTNTSMMKKSYQALVKALGRGTKGSRSLTLEESTFLITGFYDGYGTRSQLATSLMLMRVRGETTDEIAGVTLGIQSTISPEWKTIGASIDWPCYAGKRDMLPWLLLAAKVLAKEGERVLLHGDPHSLSHRLHIARYVALLGIPVVSSPKEAKSALDGAGICYLDADHLTPLVSLFRSLHQELGLRSLFQTAIRCVNPAFAPVSLRSYFHLGLDTVHAKVAKSVALFNPESKAVRVGIFKGVQGETEVNPRIATEITIVTGNSQQGFVLPTLLEGVIGITKFTSQLETEQIAELFLSVWQRGELISHNELIPDTQRVTQLAIASVLSSLSAIYLIKGRCQCPKVATQLALKAWNDRENKLIELAKNPLLEER
ncbi:glycosyl transferase family 3 [Shewanella woodyi ATCC 51908]|uniref:Glycosyl transferase family 3 n=2 Tax=Shewanella woodyi TaxID=60961 RepID=B1KPK4_SHEWM|nr:glycosyl transferase family 3 [Shewanella woodyi ATCC 51908]